MCVVGLHNLLQQIRTKEKKNPIESIDLNFLKLFYNTVMLITKMKYDKFEIKLKNWDTKNFCVTTYNFSVTIAQSKTTELIY